MNPAIGGGGDGLGSGVSIRSWNMRAGVFEIQELGGGWEICARRMAFVPGM